MKARLGLGLGPGSSGRGRQCARSETLRLRGGSEWPERNSAGSAGAEGEVGDALCQLGWGHEGDPAGRWEGRGSTLGIGVCAPNPLILQTEQESSGR